MMCRVYIEVAKKYSTLPFASFKLLDVACVDAAGHIERSEISVISATLEHIDNWQVALDNIFNSTDCLVLLRTFVGEEARKDYCLTKGAQEEYLIRQFTIDKLTKIPKLKGWRYIEYVDEATQGVGKYVCNNESIFRAQVVLVFFKKSSPL